MSFPVSGVMMSTIDKSWVLMNKRWYVLTLVIFIVTSVGCENDVSQGSVELTDVSTPSPEQMQLWANSCALCHVAGVGGAPIIGKHDDWADRIEQGSDLLLQHTLEGYNNMPPLGYCMACEKDDFTALIQFMTAVAP
ncbi:MAG: c-type cytochrome [Candidatus Azotimanducaceae bacterium WSBS_2022_MAG_OTU7]